MFSIFDDDNTFGQASQKRVVVLQGTTTINNGIPTEFIDWDSDIKRWLEADGFDVIAVRTQFAGYWTSTLNIEIECNVYTNYTAEQVRQRAIQIIESMNRSVVVTTVKMFFGTSLRVVVDNMPNASSNTGLSKNTQNQNQIPSNPNYQTNFPNSYQNNSSGGALDKFAASLGVSAPIAIVGGGLLLILLLRR